MKPLTMALVALMLGVLPAAASPHPPGIVPWLGLEAPYRDHDGRLVITPQRAAALRTCNALSYPYDVDRWGTLGNYLYKACMTEHGQVE